MFQISLCLSLCFTIDGLLCPPFWLINHTTPSIRRVQIKLCQLQTYISVVCTRQSVRSCYPREITTTVTSTTAPTAVWIHSWSFNGRCYSWSATSVKSCTENFKASAVAYVDTKAAFDSVDREALWKALQAKHMPPFLISLIKDLYTGTKSCVRVVPNANAKCLKVNWNSLWLPWSKQQTNKTMRMKLHRSRMIRLSSLLFSNFASNSVTTTSDSNSDMTLCVHLQNAFTHYAVIR